MNNTSTLIYDFITDPNGWAINEILAGTIIALVMVIFWILIGMFAIRVIKLIMNKALNVEKNGARSITIAKLLSSLTKYVVWFIVLLLILGELKIDIAPFLASAGVIGLAIGFGAQAIVKDFISGFFIIFEGAFNVGDTVEVDGFKGSILSLGLRTTIIENWLGERKIITNGNIGSIINFSRNNSVALIEFGVAYDTDLVRLKKLLDEFVLTLEEKYEDIVEPAKFLGVTKLDNSSINMRIMAKTKTMKHFPIERGVRADLVVFLNQNDVEIPFPQVVVHNA